MPRLPLDHPYFDTPALSGKERQHYIEEAKAASRDTVRQAHAMELFPVYNEMSHPKTHRRLTLRVGQDFHNPRYMCLSGHTQVSATVEAVADLYHLNAIQRSVDHVVGRNILDRTTLYTLTHRQQNPESLLQYIAMNWMAIQMPSVIADRDFSFLECHDEFKDGLDQRRGFVRSIHSLKTAACPPLEDKFGITRGSFYRSGQVFIESAGNSTVLDMYYVVCIDLQGTVAHDVLHAVMVEMVEESLNVDEYFRAMSLSQYRLVNDAPSKAHSCASCESPFKSSLFMSAKRYLCRICGRTVCEECCDLWDLHQKKLVRVCALCVEQAKDHVISKVSESMPMLTYVPGRDINSPMSVLTSQSDGSNRHSTPRSATETDAIQQKIDQLLEHDSQRSKNREASKVILFDASLHGGDLAKASNDKLKTLLKSRNDGSYNEDAIRQIEAALNN
ncbi:unnamed protein product [Aphanomyces euteiches]|uniref:FYVE-type domain-containing protein n=1 Tax=Aphanomyces euteiches TaxID=100861 RepID=A0A6G0XCF9_9STRA|nr:hypothetical protein Ae201684_006216 [Aphanomyces euteiches]KAH9068960.1 hypothetical protein Ae201684P_004657 [Aphanomyces euteiches]KAH9145869.1 hypothetical protein AeRB84_010263 [Aphanomyces euteiches]